MNDESILGQAETIRIYHEILMNQLKQNDNAMSRLEGKIESSLTDVQRELKELKNSQQESNSNLRERVATLEADFKGFNSIRQDSKSLWGLVLSIISILSIITLGILTLIHH